MTQELTFTSFDGTELFAAQDVPTAPRALAVIVHGLCEHLGRYDYLTARLNAQGVAVFRFDHRGHGRSQGKAVYYADFNEIVDDVHAAVAEAQRELPDLPTYVIGHSMGGYAAALFGTKYPSQVAGIILSGALTRYNTPLMGELPIEAPAEMYVPNSLGDGVCSDPAVGLAYEADPLVGKEISIGLINSFVGGLAYLRDNAAQFVDPVLILHGANDGLVNELDSRQLFGDIGSTDKGLIIYAGLMHEIFNEIKKDDVVADVLRWLNQRL
jgi:lysophospholipase